jgi:flagellar biosynthesis/type III secretory pathway chaperone
MATTDQTNGVKSNPILNELAIADLMTVMKDLIAVVRSENDLLHRGLPAALSDYGEQKDHLTDRFTDLSRGVLSSCTEELSDDEDLRQEIVVTGQALKSLTQENMRLLRGAMDATRRRVNSVMSAIQAESTKQGTYGASGTITAANFIDRQGGYKA